MNDYEIGPPEETICPRCGRDATQTFADADKSKVVIHCANCGVFTMTESEFSVAEAEVETEEGGDRRS